MYVSISELHLICVGKICACKKSKRITYAFTEPINSISIDWKQLIISQIQTCKNLLKSTTDKLELRISENERERQRERQRERN